MLFVKETFHCFSALVHIYLFDSLSTPLVLEQEFYLTLTFVPHIVFTLIGDITIIKLDT